MSWSEGSELEQAGARGVSWSKLERAGSELGVSWSEESELE